MLEVYVFWMPSHLGEEGVKKEKPDWVTDYEILGNKHADRLAEDAALRAGIHDLNIIEPVVEHTRLVTKIQARIASRYTHLPHRPKVSTNKEQSLKPKVSNKWTVAELELLTDHNCYKINNTVFCQICKAQTSTICPDTYRDFLIYP